MSFNKILRTTLLGLTVGVASCGTCMDWAAAEAVARAACNMQGRAYIGFNATVKNGCITKVQELCGPPGSGATIIVGPSFSDDSYTRVE